MLCLHLAKQEIYRTALDPGEVDTMKEGRATDGIALQIFSWQVMPRRSVGPTGELSSLARKLRN